MPDPSARVLVTRAGIRIACLDSGEADLPAMVLLHALGEQASDWSDGVLAPLGGRYRTIAVDLRGHGASDWPGSYSVGLMSRDVEAVLELLGLVDVVVVGHSLGGVVAFDLAVRRPDLVAALVAEDVAPPRARESRAVPTRPDGELGFDWDVVVAIRAETDRGDDELWDALAGLQAPTLIIAGGATSTVDQSLLEQAAARLPHGTLRTLEAGHYVHRERPGDFCDLLLDWLTEVRAERGSA